MDIFSFIMVFSEKLGLIGTLLWSIVAATGLGSLLASALCMTLFIRRVLSRFFK